MNNGKTVRKGINFERENEREKLCPNARNFKMTKIKIKSHKSISYVGRGNQLCAENETLVLVC